MTEMGIANINTRDNAFRLHEYFGLPPLELMNNSSTSDLGFFIISIL